MLAVPAACPPPEPATVTHNRRSGTVCPSRPQGIAGRSVRAGPALETSSPLPSSPSAIERTFVNPPQTLVVAACYRHHVVEVGFQDRLVGTVRLAFDGRVVERFVPHLNVSNGSDSSCCGVRSTAEGIGGRRRADPGLIPDVPLRRGEGPGGAGRARILREHA